MTRAPSAIERVTTAAGLRFRGLRRVFPSADGPVVALDGVDLEIEPSAFTAIVGPSGCGKSTLLHIAAGLDTQHGGTYERTPRDAITSCLFQAPRLLPWRSARRNVSFVLEARGWTRKAARERAMAVLSMVGLEDAVDRFPGQLSGGMQQRTALARALAVGPAMLLMDEPFASLDELTARRLRAELVEVHTATEVTILFVTHHIHEACFLADRVMVMSAHPGRIIGRVDIDLPRPRNYDDPRLAELAAKVLSLIESGYHGTPGS